MRLVASNDGRDGSVTINQDAAIYATVLEPGSEVSHELGANRSAWIQVARGAVTVNGNDLNQGDGAAVSAESAITIAGREESEVLLFDLA